MVDVHTQAEVEDEVRKRILKNWPTIQHSLREIKAGNPAGAETSVPRRNRRVLKKFQESDTLPIFPWDDFGPTIDKRAKPASELMEAIRGSIDFVGINFLEMGRRAADAVARVSFHDGRPQGTGFLVAPGLLLTNNHVIASVSQAAQLQVIFDYEIDTIGTLRQTSAFSFDPAACFVTDGIKGLDFTLIALGARKSGPKDASQFGYLPLSDGNDKHMLGETANIIQHPDGRPKELVLRENQLVSRDETSQVLHYVADTEGGSSGSPVFNNEWQVIALHHWGVPWREVLGKSGKPLAKEVNEGIRTSAIVNHLRGLAGMSGTPAAVDAALDLWASTPEARPQTAMSDNNQLGVFSGAPLIQNERYATMRDNRDGSISFIYPIEITVRGPSVSQPSTVAAVHGPVQASSASRAEGITWKNEDFSDRNGYEPGFIPGFVVPLPDYSDVDWRPAENQLAAETDDPHELRYHHFSIVMNADRRLCGVTAVNIDGARIKAVDRDSKTVKDEPSLKDLGVESVAGAEASDAFRPDRRILPEEQMNRPFYENQEVAGFPDKKSSERTARIFQKGHIILRGDPAWGHEDEAVAAERDTFFYTNAAPQVGFFNQGSALNRPGSKGKLRWRAVETYVLRNTVTMRARVCVFAGPVFAASDPDYRFGSKVPMKFWKIAVWSDGTALRSVALLADQKPVLEVMPENAGAEAFDDDGELARVSEFVTTVAEIERLTKLKFSSEIRAGDIRKGESAKPSASFNFSDVAPKKAKASKAKVAKRKAVKKQ